MIHLLAQIAPVTSTTSAVVSTVTSAYDPSEAQPPGWLSFAPLVLLLGFFYFAVLRPQQAGKAAAEDLVKKLKQGDRVVTSGGIFGVIVGLEDDAVSVKVADNVRFKVRRSHIAEVIVDDPKKDGAKKEPAKELKDSAKKPMP